MVTYNSKFVTFLNGENTIKFESEEELNEFDTVMNFIGVNIQRKYLHIYPEHGYVLIEYNNAKGIAIWNEGRNRDNPIKKSTEWYGMAPYTWKEVKWQM